MAPPESASTEASVQWLTYFSGLERQSSSVFLDTHLEAGPGNTVGHVFGTSFWQASHHV